MLRRSSFLLVALAALGCRVPPDNSIGKACVANKTTVSLHDCWLAGHEQGVDVGATAPGYGYDDGYQACLDEHDTGGDSGE